MIAVNMRLTATDEEGSCVVTCVVGRTEISANCTFVNVHTNMIVLAGLMRL